MTSKTKEPAGPALDAIGQEITPDAIVAAPLSTSSLMIARVQKVSPKMVTIKGMGDRGFTVRKFHAEVVVIGNSPAATMYVLMNDK